MTFFGCSGSEDGTKSIAQSIKSDIISSGFVPKAEKSCCILVQHLQWLGTVLDSEEFTISIPAVR